MPGQRGPPVDRQHHEQSASVQRRGKRGAQAQAIGRSRGGRTTKIHAIADAAGRLIAFRLSPGQMADIRFAAALVEPLPIAAYVLGDAAYDSDRFRALLIERGSTPVIPPNPTRKNVPPFDETRYRSRNLIERAFSHLKDWRRVATRYDKLARNFRAALMLAAILIWWT
jgi:transposase